MSVIWKRLQRVNKRATKYRILFELQELMVEGTSQWQPNKLSIVLNRRRRRVSSHPMLWEPTIRNPYRGLVVWSLPEILDVDVTLYRGMRSAKYEEKEWTLSIEDISPMGRPRRIASTAINISDYVDEQFAVPSRHEFFKLSLNITSKKVKEVYVTFMLTTQFLKEGKATDYDMESVTSMMSVTANDGVQNLDDDDIDIAEHSAATTAQIFEIANKFSELLQDEDETDHAAIVSLTQDPSCRELESEPAKAELQPNANGLNQSKSNIKRDLSSEYRNEIPSAASEHEQNLVGKGSQSGTSASTPASAVINFKSNASQSVQDYDRVTHSHAERQLGQTHSVTKSADRGANSFLSLDAPNSTNFATSVVSFSLNNHQNHKLANPRRLDIAPSDLCSNLIDTEQLHHNTSSTSSHPGTSDNRLKGTGFSLNESAHSEEAHFSSSDRANSSEQMPVSSAADELLSWCKRVTEGYHGVKITNMTTSWRNGMAFCAIIHHFRPDLIDFDSLKPSDVVGNCTKAFEAAFSLGIPKIIEANDMIVLTVPDKLSVMTYLYQLKSYFVGQSMLRSVNSVNSYTRYNELEEECEEDLEKERSGNRNLNELRTKCMDLFNCLDELDNAAYMHKLQPSADAPTTKQMTNAYQQFHLKKYSNNYLDNKRNNNDQVGDQVTNSRTTSRENHNNKNDNSNNNLEEHISNRKENNSRTRLMTRKQLMNPFDSDSDEEIELISKCDSKSNYSGGSTPSVSSTDSEESLIKSKTSPSSREPVRKPLQFASPNYDSEFKRPSPNISSLPTSYSTSSFPNYRFSTNSTSSVHSGLSKLAEPVEVAPGLLDLSSVKAYRLQRAFSAPSCQYLLVDPRRRPQFREEELRERARQLLESVRRDSTKDENRILSREEEERQRVLRERARKIIADAKQGIMGSFTGSSLDSPVSIASNSTTNSTNTPMLSPSEIVFNNFDNVENNVNSISNKYVIKSDFDRTKSIERSLSEVSTSTNGDSNKDKEINGNENYWTTKISEKFSQKMSSQSKTSDKADYANYPDSFESLQQEIDYIDKEQKQIDVDAAILEKRLRKLMETGGNKRLEDKLMQNWFVLVNKRNGIIRRQMQLNILEKEADMNRRYEELNQELRTLVSIDDSVKTDAQRAREKKLLEDLVQIVDKRDELVRHLDNQEKAIEEDELMENETQGPITLAEDNEKNCVIM